MDGETGKILRVGELTEIRFRERILEADHTQAIRSGREGAFSETLAFVLQQHRAAGPYDDTRPWSILRTFLQDRIRDNGATS